MGHDALLGLLKGVEVICENMPEFIVQTLALLQTGAADITIMQGLSITVSLLGIGVASADVEAAVCTAQDGLWAKWNPTYYGWYE